MLMRRLLHGLWVAYLLVPSRCKDTQDAGVLNYELTTVQEYEGAKLLAVVPLTPEQLKVVETLVDGDLGVDSWTEWTGLGMEAQLMVTKDKLDIVNKSLRDAGMEPKVILRDVAAELKAQHAEDVNDTIRATSVIGTYPRIPALYAWYDDIASQYSFVRIETFGKTWQNRDLKLVKIAKGKGLPVVFVECMVHAREWIAMASCVWFINELLTSTDQSVRALTSQLEFQFVPCSNPDGYEYTHTGRRLWRKNMNDNGGDRCKGVDLNRNWDNRWGTSGVSRTNKCQDNYCGTGPWSEPETRALSDHVMTLKGRAKAYVAFHCYTQLWLVPPGAGPKPPDFAELMRVGKEAARRVGAKHGLRYTAGSPQDILYSASGSSLDWAHDPVKGPGIKYVYTPELRPDRRSRFGFQLPVSQIHAASEEAFEGLKYIAEVVAQQNPVTTPAPDGRRRRRTPAGILPIPEGRRRRRTPEGRRRGRRRRSGTRRRRRGSSRRRRRGAKRRRRRR